MRLRPRPILVFLALGTLISVAVSWACTIRLQSLESVPKLDVQDPLRFRWLWPPTISTANTTPNPRESSGFGYTVLTAIDFAFQDAPTTANYKLVFTIEEQREQRTGWPLPCLITRSTRSDTAPARASPNVAVGTIEYSRGFLYSGWPFEFVSHPTNNVWLPLRPHWPAFIFNVACWSALLATLSAANRALITRSRRRRNLCIKCGYPKPPQVTGANPGPQVCPECGSPLEAAPPAPSAAHS